ncbi:hypothetical protein D9C73_010514 [Collichthys lucidus]|uniref:Ig-like domain-containing protein n=1 Tax=Collichthys lucidus TaxID=240159 RepID=A0A4U5UKF8_COLLU|nr:hypothetical protein D9C73_010514 [Collichthys lucidus]
MADFRWIQVSLFVIALLQFTETEGSSSFTVRAGQEVTLPCKDVIGDQQNCDRTSWEFSNSMQGADIALIRLGQIVENSKSDRLSVTQNCSLVIKKLTHEDGGWYDCLQYKPGRIDSWSTVFLSVVTMTEHETNDQVELNCSVSTYDGWCAHTVKWLFEGKDVDEDHKDLQTSQSVCSASVTFTTSSNSDSLTCEVTDGDRVELFPFRLQPSGEEPGDDTATKPRPEPTTKPPTATTKPPTATTKPPTATTKPPTATATTKPPTATTKPPTATTKPPTATTKPTESSMKRGTITTAPADNGSANLKGKKTLTDEDVADPEGGVSYASINFTQRPGGKARDYKYPIWRILFKRADAVRNNVASRSADEVAYFTTLLHVKAKLETLC